MESVEYNNNLEKISLRLTECNLDRSSKLRNSKKGNDYRWTIDIRRYLQLK